MITLPKRKLRLWYNKNDYLKERENEKKLSETNQNDNVTEPVLTDEKTETTIIDDTIPPVENAEMPSVENETKSLQTETQKEVLPIETQADLKQAEIPSSKSNINEEGSNKEKIQIEPNSAITLTQTQAEQTPTESYSNPQIIEKETQETSLVNDIVSPVDVKQKQALIELKWVKDQDKLADPLTRPNAEQEILSVESIKEEEAIEIENKVPMIESVVDIEKYTDSLKRLLPTKAVVCIGEYPINIILNSSFIGKKDQGVLPIFVEKSTKDVIKWSQGRLENGSIVCLDEDIDSHFWYDILPYVVENESFFEKIKGKPIEKLLGAIIVSSTWNGIGSALLPSLSTQFKEWNINSIALPLLPSKAQPLDNQFNSLACIGILASRKATLLLIDRDKLETYTGIDRNGFGIYGNMVINYLLDLILTKETFAQELCELSNSFDTKMFTTLLASGVSLKIYETLENMLDTTLLRPLFTFDLSSATILYVLVRMPFNLKDKFPRGKIEVTITNWFKDKADLESIYIADPIYVEDSSDRMDIAMFVGGFETATRFATIEKKVAKMKDQAVKKGLITEEDWQAIAKSLLNKI